MLFPRRLLCSVILRIAIPQSCISELGATEDMLEGIADGTLVMNGGYKVLDHEEIVNILKESF